MVFKISFDWLLPFIAEMNLLDLLLAVLDKARSFFAFVFTRDFSVLNKELFGISMVDLIALFVVALTLKDFISFVIKFLTTILKNISRQLFNEFGKEFLLKVRIVLLRAKATLKYLWKLDQIQILRFRIQYFLTKQFYRLISKIK